MLLPQISVTSGYTALNSFRREDSSIPENLHPGLYTWASLDERSGNLHEQTH
jgi:hypothetical protein